MVWFSFKREMHPEMDHRFCNWLRLYEFTFNLRIVAEAISEPNRMINKVPGLPLLSQKDYIAKISKISNNLSTSETDFMPPSF